MNEILSPAARLDAARTEINRLRAEKVELVAELTEIVRADEASLVELEKLGIPRSEDSMRLVNLARAALAKAMAMDGKQ